MEKSLKNPKRVFPFHGQTRIPRRVGLKPGEPTRQYSTRFEVGKTITVPCRIGYERPYGDRWLKLWHGELPSTPWGELTDQTQATVFKNADVAAEWLERRANDGPTPWSLFVEPVE